MKRIVCGFLSLLTSAFAPAAMAQHNGPLLHSLTKDAVEALAVEAGWAIGPRTETGDGEYNQTFTTAGGLPIQFHAWACGSDEAAGCEEYQLSLTFGVGSSERARMLKESLTDPWVNTSLMDGEVVVIRRVEFLYGGVGRDHLKETFSAFEEVTRDAAAKAFPCGLPVDGLEPSC